MDRPPDNPAQAPTLSEIAQVFGRIGVLSFGGPAAQIALMHRELVEVRPWLTEDEFLRATSFCMLLPGPEAMQLATFAGWRLRGTSGGLIAGLLFVLPGAAAIFALAMLYLRFGNIGGVQAAFAGLKAAVLVIVAQAIWRLSKKALAGPSAVWLACLAFAGLFLFGLPFPLIIAAAAGFGAVFWAKASAPDASTTAARLSLRPVVLGGALWAAPILVAALAGNAFLVDLGLFFSKLAVVTFGGAYAVLAYMTQEVVQTHGWLTTGQMIDGLGLAETTPGPLILVTQFVGHLAGAQHGMAALAGIYVLWMTFVPCFIWIFAGAPLIDWLAGQARLAAGLRAVTAAVVGVIANLSFWFALHVLFDAVRPVQLGPIQTVLPVPGSLNIEALLLVGLAAALLIGARAQVWAALGLCALAGLGLSIFA